MGSVPEKTIEQYAEEKVAEKAKKVTDALTHPLTEEQLQKREEIINETTQDKPGTEKAPENPEVP